MESNEEPKPRQMPKPDIVIKNFSTALPFYSAKVSRNAMVLLALASHFRICGANLYQIISNHDLAAQLFMSYGKFMRAKKELKDKSLLDYNGQPGDYSNLIANWEKATGEKWEADL